MLPTSNFVEYESDSDQNVLKEEENWDENQKDHGIVRTILVLEEIVLWISWVSLISPLFRLVKEDLSVSEHPIREDQKEERSFFNQAQSSQIEISSVHGWLPVEIGKLQFLCDV